MLKEDSDHAEDMARILQHRYESTLLGTQLPEIIEVLIYEINKVVKNLNDRFSYFTYFDKHTRLFSILSDAFMISSAVQAQYIPLILNDSDIEYS